jgi:hypothetical protein
MSLHRILIYALVFVVGYVAARYMPQAGQAVGLP